MSPIIDDSTGREFIHFTITVTDWHLPLTGLVLDFCSSVSSVGVMATSSHTTDANTTGRNKSCSLSYIRECQFINRQCNLQMNILDRELSMIKQDLSKIKKTSSGEADRVADTSIPLSWSASNSPESRRNRLPLRKVGNNVPTATGTSDWQSEFRRQTSGTVHRARSMLWQRQERNREKSAVCNGESAAANCEQTSESHSASNSRVTYRPESVQFPMLDKTRQKIFKRVSADLRKKFRIVGDPWKDSAFIRRAMLVVEEKYQEELSKKCKQLADDIEEDRERPWITVGISEELQDPVPPPKIKRKVSFVEQARRESLFEIVSERPPIMKEISEKPIHIPEIKLPEATHRRRSIESELLGRSGEEDSLQDEPIDKGINGDTGEQQEGLTEGRNNQNRARKTWVGLLNPRAEIQEAVANLSVPDSNIPGGMRRVYSDSNIPHFANKSPSDSRKTSQSSFPEKNELRRRPSLATEARAQRRRSSVYLIRMLEDEKRARNTAEQMLLEKTRKASKPQNVSKKPDTDSDDDDEIHVTHTKLPDSIVNAIATDDWTFG